jgi:NAD(P)-dependent dehydrogenase (short-subunit alcohol dehydrogenase family)
MKLTGKFALVTGAAGGIGLAIARQLVDAGAAVFITDVQPGVLTVLADAPEVTARHHDVTRESDWQQVLAAVQARYGRLDILVNNAGTVSGQSIADTDLDTWNRVLAINLTATMLGCRFGIETMRHNPAGSCGSIINIASTTSCPDFSSDAAYTASKAAVVALTRSVATWCALERLNIRCNSLHPGATYTAILQAHGHANPARFDMFAGMGRKGALDEVARQALFLAANDSGFSSGAQFAVDGGISSAHPSL